MRAENGKRKMKKGEWKCGCGIARTKSRSLSRCRGFGMTLAALPLQTVQPRLRSGETAQDFYVGGTVAPHRDDLRGLGVGNSAAHQLEQSSVVNPQISQRAQ